MYRALYDYKSNLKECLSFEAGDRFSAFGHSRGDWIQVENGFGEIGYVPNNYVTREDQAARAEVLQSVDRAIQNIHYQATASGKYTNQQRENLKKLSEHRENVLKGYTYSSTTKTSEVVSGKILDKQKSIDSQSQKRVSVKRSAPPPPVLSTTQSSAIQGIQHSQKHYSQCPVSHSPAVTRNTKHLFSHQSHQQYAVPHGSTQMAYDTASRSVLYKSDSLPSHIVVDQSPEAPTVPQCSTAGTVENGWVKVNHSTEEHVSGLNSDSRDNSLKQADSGQTTLMTDKSNSIDIDIPGDGDGTSNVSLLLESGSEVRSKTPTTERTDSYDNVTSHDSIKSHDNAVLHNNAESHDNLVPHSMTASFTLSPTRSLKSLPTSPSKQLGSPSVINLNSLPLPTNMAAEIIEEVRRHTGLSYDKSGLAVEVVLNHIASRMPQTAVLMEKIMATFTEASNTSDEEESHDSKLIQELFTKLTECKDDAQQRSWALHQDQQIILQYLEELLSIMENAKPSICRRAVARDSYESIHNLVQYYQMESRLPLRLALLKVFGSMCSLEAAVVSHLLYSILPLELVSEIQNQYQDAQRLSFVTLVLTMIFSTGEPVPLNLHDHMNKDFFHFLLDQIESPCTTDHEDQCSDLLVQLLLSYNLHFEDVSDNLIMVVLAEKGTAKEFTEKLLLILNRGEDPIKMFDHQKSQKHSVMKFMLDLYSQPATSMMLYTNDAKVLIDIIIRQLTDLQPGDQIRSSFLILTKLILTNSDYFEHKHRLSEWIRSLEPISKEESGVQLDKEEATLSLDILQTKNDQ